MLSMKSLVSEKLGGGWRSGGGTEDFVRVGKGQWRFDVGELKLGS
jgi:hypothetical protein